MTINENVRGKSVLPGNGIDEIRVVTEGGHLVYQVVKKIQEVLKSWAIRWHGRDEEKDQIIE